MELDRKFLAEILNTVYNTIMKIDLFHTLIAKKTSQISIAILGLALILIGIWLISMAIPGLLSLGVGLYLTLRGQSPSWITSLRLRFFRWSRTISTKMQRYIVQRLAQFLAILTSQSTIDYTKNDEIMNDD